MKPMTINQVKQSFREGNSIMIDELKDPYELRKYFYRLERFEIIYKFMENNHYIIYAMVRPGMIELN